MNAEVFITLIMLWVFTGVAAFWESKLFPSQMCELPQDWPALPLTSNGAWWGNLVILTPALLLIYGYHNQWSEVTMYLCFGIGLASTLALSFGVYKKGKLPDALIGGGNGMSVAGWINAAFSTIAIGLVLLFYFSTKASVTSVLFIGALLASYGVVANHVPLQWLFNRYDYPWLPDHGILKNEKTPLRILCATLALLGVATSLKLWLV